MTYLDYLKETGCDVEGALKRLNGNADFYRTLLRHLIKDTNLKELIEVFGKYDLTESFNKAHTLKGVLANLGIIPYYEKISLIIVDLKENNLEGVDFLIQDFDKEYTEFIMGLEKLL